MKISLAVQHQMASENNIFNILLLLETLMLLLPHRVDHCSIPVDSQSYVAGIQVILIQQACKAFYLLNTELTLP